MKELLLIVLFALVIFLILPWLGNAGYDYYNWTDKLYQNFKYQRWYQSLPLCSQEEIDSQNIQGRSTLRYLHCRR